MADEFSRANDGLFVRPAMCVELNADSFEISRDMYANPHHFDGPVLRITVHETLHFWQTLSQGFTANLAAEEWRAVLAFERTGKPSPRPLHAQSEPAPGNQQANPWHLMEALTRFWDLMIVNPVTVRHWKRQLEFFAEPRILNPSPPNDVNPIGPNDFDDLLASEKQTGFLYREALDAFGSKATVFAFPLAAHFALQTRDPMRVYRYVVERIAHFVTQWDVLSRLENASDVMKMMAVSKNLTDGWNQLWKGARMLCDKAAFNGFLQYVTPGWDVLMRSSVTLPTNDDFNPVFAHYRALLELSLRGVGRDRLDLMFAVPGNPLYRGFLAAHFLPAAIVFNNGVQSPPPPLEGAEDGGFALPMHVLAEEACAARARWHAFLDSERLVYGSEKGA